MRSVRELPELVTEFFDMAKRYLRQQTVEPAKRLGRLAGFSLLASMLFVLAALFLAVAGMRAIVEVMPDGAVWSGLGYIVAALALLGIMGLVMWRATR